MLMVQKFGGSSVATTEKILNVAKRIVENYDNNNSIVVILSAMGNTTNELIGQASSINNNIDQRELDMLLVTGEQQSCALMAMAIKSLGYPAISLNAYQAGISVSNNFGDAQITNINTDRIQKELKEKKIVIITGFQGINDDGDIATLGRGGSDTTAVAVAHALGAKVCEIYTDVEGVYTADPNTVPTAMKLDEITYTAMLELASEGAKVLHNRSVEIAKSSGVHIIVRSSLNTAKGTVVKENIIKKMRISGIAIDNTYKDGYSKISIVGERMDCKDLIEVVNESLVIENINYEIAYNSTIRLSIVVPKNYNVVVAKVLHDKLISI